MIYEDVPFSQEICTTQQEIKWRQKDIFQKSVTHAFFKMTGSIMSAMNTDVHIISSYNVFY